MNDIFSLGDRKGSFIWDAEKERLNMIKHDVDFRTAAQVFSDPDVRIRRDLGHSAGEERFFAVGKIGGRLLTVRFTYRHSLIRIFGAGYWRSGRGFYESKKE